MRTETITLIKFRNIVMRARSDIKVRISFLAFLYCGIFEIPLVSFHSIFHRNIHTTSSQN